MIMYPIWDIVEPASAFLISSRAYSDDGATEQADAADDDDDGRPRARLKMGLERAIR